MLSPTCSLLARSRRAAGPAMPRQGPQLQASFPVSFAGLAPCAMQGWGAPTGSMVIRGRQAPSGVGSSGGVGSTEHAWRRRCRPAEERRGGRGREVRCRRCCSRRPAAANWGRPRPIVFEGSTSSPRPDARLPLTSCPSGVSWACPRNYRAKFPHQKEVCNKCVTLYVTGRVAGGVEQGYVTGYVEPPPRHRGQGLVTGYVTRQLAAGRARGKGPTRRGLCVDCWWNCRP
jgi:hypothetical protein